MLTKLKLALVASAALVAGATTFAVADAGGSGNADIAAKRGEWKQKMLEKYDINNDGKLDPSERAAMRHDRMVESFKKLDTNGDGVVSFSEFEAGAKLGMGRGMHRKMHHRGMMKQAPSAPVTPGAGST
jgi:EF-hand domain pair